VGKLHSVTEGQLVKDGDSGSLTLVVVAVAVVGTGQRTVGGHEDGGSAGLREGARGIVKSMAPRVGHGGLQSTAQVVVEAHLHGVVIEGSIVGVDGDAEPLRGEELGGGNQLRAGVVVGVGFVIGLAANIAQIENGVLSELVLKLQVPLLDGGGWIVLGVGDHVDVGGVCFDV